MERDGYVLDGIQTAMEVVEIVGQNPREVSTWCPCGWQRLVEITDPSHALEVYASARFHYTHCPSARPPSGDKP